MSKKVTAPKTKSKAPQGRTAEESMLLAGLTAFHTHHQATYKSRWLKSLYPALLLQHPSVAVINRHLGEKATNEIRKKLMERGARRWYRGNEPFEIECWRFEDEVPTTKVESVDQTAEAIDQLSIQPSSTSSTTSAASVDQIEPDESPITETRFLPPTPLDQDVSPLLPYYLLDGASVLAVDALTVGPFHQVLDLCAAPGGKSICIAQSLDLLDLEAPTKSELAAASPSSSSSTLAFTQPFSMLHANEPQASRRTRLQNVLSEYLPPIVRKNRTRVEVTGWDATKISLPQQRYDRILVDAPCSSDRHVLKDSKELTSWSVKRIQTNAERQEILLLNALKAVKIGGIVVYATCSLSKRENDQVIQNVLEKLQKNKRNGGANQVHVQVLKIRLTGTESQYDTTDSTKASSSTLASDEDDVLYLPLGEPTKYGWMVLPDQAAPQLPTIDVDGSAASSSTTAASQPQAIGHGFGPLYFSRLKRISNVAAGEEESEDEEEDSEEEESSEEEEEDEQKAESK